MSVPYYIFVDMFDHIEKDVIRELTFEGDINEGLLNRINDYFNTVKDAVSFGYLQRMIKSDKDIIRKELRSVKDRNSELRPF